MTGAEHVASVGAEGFEEGREVVQRYGRGEARDVQHVVLAQVHFAGRDVSGDDESLAELGRAEGPIDPHPLVEDALALGPQNLDGTLADPHGGVVGYVGRF